MNENDITPSNIGLQSRNDFNTHFKKGHKHGMGRLRGSRNQATIAMEELLQKGSTGLMGKCLDMAMDGGTSAMKLCLDRLFPPAKDRPIQIDVRKMTKISDAVEVMAEILQSVTEGIITPTEAMNVANVIEIYRKTIETNDIDIRVVALEEIMRESKTF